MKGKTILLILVVVFLVAGGSVWYARNKAAGRFGDTAGKTPPFAQSPVASSTTANALDITALEKQLGIEIKEIDPPTSDVDTSGWKTYRDEEYGFEVKYPGGVIKLDTKEERRTLQHSYFYFRNVSGLPNGFNLVVWNDSIDRLIRIYIPDGESRPSETNFFETFQYKGYPVFHRVGVGIFDPQRIESNFDLKHEKYVLSISGQETSNKTLQAIFNTLTFF